ncbi:TetR/AcrR family transcriptional regulator C-terminal domain-containing protein [Streptomyces sp. ISL-44]|uniref:TetR/AcrR family transcriptional regulator n=1 Tax=Streptomyces sp. ISL-44 TaxID=2819184 RepID=UPI001BE737F2|nr:TetR/AcrR family transcriptional regulator [Streptomyces sp. ISL-44]MBT2544787.1 TetR/AcrR family transcriptional regulator C-terminal domain-containing protein [Streptomyces sp. ISL-44]
MSADEKQQSPAAPAVPSVWTRPRRPKEQQPALSQAQIVAAAVKLLDAEGIEALSMRKLGTGMGAAATSLYRHVANKDELIELVVDEVYGELEVPEATDPAGWRESVSRSGHSLRAMALRHPWVASVLGQVGLAHLGPNLMRMSERMLALFQAAGFPVGEADLAMKAVISYVVGATTSEAAYLSLLARSGQSEQEWLESLRPAAEQALAGHPLLAEGQSAQESGDPRRMREENFDYGLQRVLDGLEARLSRN